MLLNYGFCSSFGLDGISLIVWAKHFVSILFYPMLAISPCAAPSPPARGIFGF